MEASSGTLVIVHLFGTCPQLSRHVISGTGIPNAVQLITKVCPISTVRVGGGQVTISGGTENQGRKSNRYVEKFEFGL